MKITPSGQPRRRVLPLDRALVFEDPDGTRILYDAGRTVRGPDDPRLGKIDAIRAATSTAITWVISSSPRPMPALVPSPISR